MELEDYQFTKQELKIFRASEKISNCAVGLY